MRVAFGKSLLLIALVSLFSAMAFADSVPVGIFSYDVTGLGTFQFDITNETGVNSGGGFMVTNTIFLSSLSLTVNLSNGTTETFGSSYFTLSPDGISFTGSPLSTLIPVTSATLTGQFSSTTFNLSNGTSVTVLKGFTVTLTDSSGSLQDGDIAIINGQTSAATPEPETLTMMGTGLAALGAFRRKYLAAGLRRLLTARVRAATVAIGLCCLAIVLSTVPGALATTGGVTLNTWANPPSGLAGQNNTNLVGSGFPTGTIAPGSVNIAIAGSCMGSGATTTTAIKVTKVLGTSERVEFLLPASLATGTYFVSIAGKTTTGTSFASANCSEVKVTGFTTVTCLPSSSIGVLTTTTAVQAYVPNACWDCTSTGVQFVPIEGGGSNAAIATANPVNACSSNSVTGQTACTANNTDVYLITGSTLGKTLTSGSNSGASFSGGTCENCGVAIDPLTNTAYIEMGYNSGYGVQALNLTNNSFTTPTQTAYPVSENIAVDPKRNLILSPGESGVYDLFQIGSTGALSEFGYSIGGELDSAAEDCSTGIALASVEFTEDVFIADLTQAKFTSGTPGSWTAPSQFLAVPDFEGFAAGTSGISVAPGISHLGVVTGEFGGSQFGVVALPTTSGSGTPTLSDWAGANVPSTPDGLGFSGGFDPHTITAYVSPNTQKPYAVIADWATGLPTYLAVIDLQALLAAPRLAGVDAGGNSCPSCTHSVDPSYDLVAHSVIKFVKTN